MMPLIPVIAFGTRGDIWPVISILYQLIHENTFVSSIKFVFITHNCFVSECALHLNSSYVEVLGMNSSPIVVTGADKFESNYANLLQERFNGSEVALVLSNLFALDSWLLAVQWRVRCVYIHPNCPYPDKGSRDVVLNTLKVQHSCLHQYLQKKSTPDHLQWTDYNEFLWPTLVSEYMDSQHAAIESEFASNELILGPIVLLLTSPRFAPPPSLLEGGTRTWLPRYHTCGFINYRSMYKQQEFKLEPHIFGVASSDGCISSATSAGACHNSCLCRLIRTTAELLDNISNGDADNTLPLVCVDFGSMTQVLVEQDRLRHILLVIKHLMQYWRFVVVCHGYSAHIIRILEASPRSAEMTGISDQSSSSSNILLIEHSLDHCAVFPKCVTVIHHGGIGTVGTCLHCGVPQRK